MTTCSPWSGLAFWSGERVTNYLRGCKCYKWRSLVRAVDRYSRSANWPTNKNLKSVKVEAWNWTVNERNQCLYHGLTIRVSQREGNTAGGEEKFLPLTSRSCQFPRSSLVIEIDLKPNRYTNISSLRRAFVSVFSACTQSSVQFVWPKHSVFL